MNNKILDSYFFILFSIIPVSIILGPAMSLIVILLIDFSFVFLLLYKKEYKFLSNRAVKLILLFCLYLIFNSIISKDFATGALRNFSFLRFGILFCAFNYFFYYKTIFNKIFIIWLLFLFLIIIDIYVESFTGTNILGYGEDYPRRIVSFFKDETIAGGYVNAFYLILIGYCFSLNNKFSKNYKYFILAGSLFFFVAILLTVERSNTIKAFLGLLIFYAINDHFNAKQKILSALGMLMVIGILFNSSESLKFRYGTVFLTPIADQFRSEKKLSTSNNPNVYLNLYRSGIKVFKENPLLGVGNKNYRIVCNSESSPKISCSTHPHQVYFEFMAEHGILGSMVLFFILFNLIFSKSIIILRSKNYIQIGAYIFLLISFIPFLPSGAFFSDYSLTIFWLNLSLMYSVNKKTNIYSYN